MTFSTDIRNIVARHWIAILAAVIVVVCFTAFTPHFVNIAHAQTTGTTAASGSSAGNTTAPATPAQNPFAWVLGSTIAAVAQFIFYISGFLFGLAGMLFNWVIVLTVFQFGAYFGNSPGMLLAWGVLRDIGNILLLFGFIFMGILMILDLHNGIDTKKAIPGLIIFAVLLNFSLFGAEAVVDVSNVLSAAIFNQAGQCTSVSCINGTAQSSSSGIGGTVAASTNTGISGVIITTLGLATLFHPSSATQSALSGNALNAALFNIGAALFVTIAMGVLLAGSIMLLIRAITLAFLLVVSPIGLAAMAIPPLRGIGSTWWKTLLNQSFFAPVFLLLMLVSIKILTGIGTQSGSASFADAIASPSSSNLGIILIFILMIGFLIASILVAKSMGAMGADFAINVAKKTVTGTVGAPFRGAGYLGGIAFREGVGGRADSARKSYGNFIARQVAKGGVTAGVARAFDITLGSSIEGNLKKVADTRVGGARSFNEQREHEKDRDKHISHIQHEQHTTQLTEDIKAGLKDDATELQQDTMHRAWQQLPEAEKVKLLNTLDEKARGKLAKSMSFSAFKGLYANHDLSTPAKDQLLSRYDELRAAVEKGDAKVVKEMGKSYNADEYKFLLANIPDLADTVVSMEDPETGSSVVSEAVLRELYKSDAPSENQKREILAAQKVEKIKKIYADADERGTAVDVARVAKLARSSTAKEYAELSNAILLRPEVAAEANREKITALMSKEGAFDKNQRQQFLENREAKLRSLAQTDPEYKKYKDDYDDVQEYFQNNKSPRGWWGVPAQKPVPPPPPLQDKGIANAFSANPNNRTP